MGEKPRRNNIKVIAEGKNDVLGKVFKISSNQELEAGAQMAALSCVRKERIW